MVRQSYQRLSPAVQSRGALRKELTAYLRTRRVIRRAHGVRLPDGRGGRPGILGLGSTYMRALDPWGDELQLIHYDQRGSGNTPVGDVQRVSFTGGVEDLEGLRQSLGLGHIQVLGHSTGAYLAALYAAEHPATTAGVVLLNPGRRWRRS